MHFIDLERKYSYEELLRQTICLANTYKPFLTLTTYGQSVQGREIIGLKIGFGPTRLLCTGGVHGRESINPVVLVRIAEHYAKNYYHHPMFKEHSCLILPLVNPDGYTIAAAENPWHKENARGIDLNRNFASATFCPTSRMPAPFSEPESRIVREVMSIPQLLCYLDFHSRGNTIYYYRNQKDKAYNLRQKEIALYLSHLTGYSLQEPELELDPNSGGGNTVHYFSEYIDKPALTIETAPDQAEFPMDACYQRTVYSDIQMVPFYCMEKFCYYSCSNKSS